MASERRTAVGDVNKPTAVETPTALAYSCAALLSLINPRRLRNSSKFADPLSKTRDENRRGPLR